MLVLFVGFALMIKRELVYQFLMNLRVFEVVSEKSLDMKEQVCDLMLLLFVWCYLLANKFIKFIVIILNQLYIFWMNFGHAMS